jgi:hypothetical protein
MMIKKLVNSIFWAAVLCFLIPSANGDLIGHWALDEESGAVASDSSPSGWDGIVSAGAEGNWLPDGGKLDGTLDFTGQDYIIVSDFVPTNGIVTVGAWAYARSRPGWSNLVTNWAGETGQLHFGQNPGGLLTLHYTQSSGASLNTGDSEAFPLEEWQHCAFVADGTNLIVYRNGNELNRIAYDGTAKQSLPLLGIGCKPNGNPGAPAPDGGVPAYWDGFIDDVTLFDHALTQDDINKLMEGLGAKELAADPAPEDAAVDVVRGSMLRWEAGEFAATHDLYLGTDFDDVNDASRANPGSVLVSQNQDDTSYDVGILEFGETYYWRVDEVNTAPDSTVFKGEIWHFTIEPYAIPVAIIMTTASSSHAANMGPENTLNGIGLNALDQHSTEPTDMWLSGIGDPNPSIQYEFDKTYKLHELWVWNSNQLIEAFVGIGAKDVIIESSVDGSEWIVVEGATLLNQATGTADYTANTVIDLGGILARFVKITINAGYGMMPQFGLSELRFLHIPTFAREPEPADGSVTQGADIVLGWRSGREAASSEVYLGTEAADLALLGTTTGNSITTSGLNYATTYSWSVTEVNNAEAIASYAGDMWSFTTPDFGTVDDFEQYDNNCRRIFFAWKDGLGHNGGEEVDDCDVLASNGNDGGSIVGNATAPFAENTIVNIDSQQSLPLEYDNTFGPSEATLTLSGQDWSASNVQTLSLFFYGQPDNGGQLYVKINNIKVVYTGDAADITQAQWQQWNIDLTSLDGLQNVTTLTIGVDGVSAAGMLYIDDIRLYP